MASLVAQTVKRLPAMRETWVWSLGRKDPLEKKMAIHSSTLAWKIPWTEEPDRLQSMGSRRVGHDWATSLSLSLLWCYSSVYWVSITLHCLAMVFNVRDVLFIYLSSYSQKEKKLYYFWISANTLAHSLSIYVTIYCMRETSGPKECGEFHPTKGLTVVP